MGMIEGWHKSSYSGGNGTDCVEVANHGNAVLVRDTKNREGAHLAVDAAEWRRFVAEVKGSLRSNVRGSCGVVVLCATLDILLWP